MIQKNEIMLKKFENFLLSSGLSNNTARAYINTMIHLESMVKKPLEKVSREEIMDFQTQYRKGKFASSSKIKVVAQERGLSASGMKRQVSALRSFYEDYLELFGVVPKKRIKGKPRTKIEKKYTQEEIQKILNSCYEIPQKVAIGIGYSWGLRVSEATQLVLSDVDFKNQTVRILGKGNKEVVMEMLPIGFDFVREYLSENFRDSSIDRLLQYEKKGLNYPVYLHKLERWLREATDIARLPYHGFHSLRHSLVSHLLDNGWSMREVQLYVRHSSMATTADIYAHEINTAVRKKGLKLKV